MQRDWRRNLNSMGRRRMSVKSAATQYHRSVKKWEADNYVLTAKISTNERGRYEGNAVYQWSENKRDTRG